MGHPVDYLSVASYQSSLRRLWNFDRSKPRSVLRDVACREIRALGQELLDEATDLDGLCRRRPVGEAVEIVKTAPPGREGQREAQHRPGQRRGGVEVTHGMWHQRCWRWSALGETLLLSCALLVVEIFKELLENRGQLGIHISFLVRVAVSKCLHEADCVVEGHKHPSFGLDDVEEVVGQPCEACRRALARICKTNSERLTHLQPLLPRRLLRCAGVSGARLVCLRQHARICPRAFSTCPSRPKSPCPPIAIRLPFCIFGARCMM